MMFEDITICPLSGLPIKKEEIIHESGNPLVFEYRNNIIGGVKLSYSDYLRLRTKDGLYQQILPILSGICRHHFEKYKRPFILSEDILDGGYKEWYYPSHFKEKAYYFLKYVFESGGAEYQGFYFRPAFDYPLAFAKDRGEFARIISKLKDDYFIDTENEMIAEGGTIVYLELKLTKYGIEEIEKDLPIVPLVGLVDQEITTGDLSVDEKINHAKKLFFNPNSTSEDKRSSCETLSFILEPYREDLKNFFNKADVSDFFRIVNEFDIRHNKENTKTLQHDEQLEWIFYTLLNTITCYTKLKLK